MKTNEWKKDRETLKEIYLEKGITSCELRFEGCWRDNALSFAHRFKRNDPRCENTYNGTLLLCNSCHGRIENDRELTEEVFKRLRS